MAVAVLGSIVGDTPVHGQAGQRGQRGEGGGGGGGGGRGGGEKGIVFGRR